MLCTGSMLDIDPNNLRLRAAKRLVNNLIAYTDATSGQTADQVTVVQFSDVAEVLYPIGDPSGAAVDGRAGQGWKRTHALQDRQLQ